MARESATVKPPVAPPAARTLADIEGRLEAHQRTYDADLLKAVYDFSEEMHSGQLRRSGEPYFIHPVNVSYLLADLRFDDRSVAVGLLHDVLEDTLTTREILREKFGDEITEMVDGVTKISRHEYVRRDEAQAETFRKMILASAKDVRVIVVKLADRLHNMMTLEHLPNEARRRISRETLEIYAPLAHRLGMSRVQADLEELAFYYLYPLQFAELHTKIQQEMKIGQGTIRRIRERLDAALAEAGIAAEITFRVKRYYSIYQKLRRQGIDISQLYDYLAFRVITERERDTYAALGVVHQTWRPIMGRFKDYIAVPKPNGYQSLHTTVVGEKGQHVEVQIRTREMDLVAEEGIAAHWHYKEGAEPKESDPNILWLRQLLEWQKEVQDPRTFLTSLKIDLYPEEVYVFTPKGEVFSFPRGVTPLDFAYKIHTELGHHCAGARVNGKLVPLRTELHNGDMVEILTNPNRQPSRDWLNVVVTTRAKSKIRHWLNTQQKRRAVEIGRRLVEKEARKFKIPAKTILEGDTLEQYLKDEGLNTLDEMLSRIGFGKIQARQVVQKVGGQDREPPEEEPPSRLRQAVTRLLPGRGDGPILVKGHGDLLAYMAKCCNPLPGERIVGYITRGRGVSVHSVDCPNVKNLLYNPEREIEVRWAKELDDVFETTVFIETEDQKGMLAKLTQVVAGFKSNITSIGARTTETGQGLIEMKLEVRDRKHLGKILQGLRSASGVLKVTRRMAASSPAREASEAG
jgi:GTP pyrophosphokinase